tara:strand:+ start:1193 stop:1684 length:492 start_codon:yes stop_codon:yes gene_type:complete
MVDAPKFDAPIPGMSLTTEVGNRPWQQPPRFTKTKDVAEYYVEKLAEDNFADMLVDVAETGIPLTSIANTIQMNSVMQGIHSVDSGILALPVIMEMMLITVEAAGIEYNSGMEEDTSNKPMSTELLLSKLKSFSTEQMNEEPEDMPMPVMEPDMGGGLMSRRQ